jgi:hypothetical protein
LEPLKNRIDLAATWLDSKIKEDREACAGWGWVPEVVPNPQNTAEVVCAFRLIGREIPLEPAVLRLLKKSSVERAEPSEWPFHTVIDYCWRLRALRYLLDAPEDPLIIGCEQFVIEAQDQDEGGWAMTAGSVPLSITATTSAVAALLTLPTSVDAPEAQLTLEGIPAAWDREEALSRRVRAIQLGTRFVIEATLNKDRRAAPLYAAAQTASLLAQPAIADLRSDRARYARQVAMKRVINHLEAGDVPVDPEVFQRGLYTDTWRHLTLHISLLAVVQSEPEKIFHPAFRKGLIRLLDLQATGEQDVDRGAFRTSSEGFPTTYATTLALEVLHGFQIAATTNLNPGRVFDFVSASDGEHPTDPRQLFRKPRVMLNSYASLLLLVIAVAGGVAIGALAIAYKSKIDKVIFHAALVWGVLLVAVGTNVFVAIRFPEVPRGVTGVVFVVATVVALPVIAFLLT